ncbi:SNO glutamine amidotransferase [Violaceomyces palustris]|uniref:SNO glutamine amidotransferase n=1 Tax=Violaceomyces palustris TaxID=1673888 RepID=A0ACD0NQQ8_9BASI|nr:SNO glutamine amidotransferase [Violaceomyces palustris]
MSNSPSQRKLVTVGVLAIQGAFSEHLNQVSHLSLQPPYSHSVELSAKLVKRPEDLSQCQVLILPGGESTVIAMGCRRVGLFEPLREWVRSGKPVWGTCAGMILLSNQATGGKKGGQELIGGVDIRVNRNGYGAQIFSFETNLSMPCLEQVGDHRPFPGVFIRAPVVERLLHSKLEPSSSSSTFSATTESGTSTPIEKVTSYGGDGAAEKEEEGLIISYADPQPPTESDQSAKRPPLEVLATLQDDLDLPQQSTPPTTTDSRIVALKQGNIMVTSFHPELTSDRRILSYFIEKVALPAIL